MKAQHFTESIASGVLEAELYKERCRLELRSGGNINQYGGVSKGDFVFNCLFLPLESNRSSNWIVFMQWICIQWILMAWTVLFYSVLSCLLDPFWLQIHSINEHLALEGLLVDIGYWTKKVKLNLDLATTVISSSFTATNWKEKNVGQCYFNRLCRPSAT